MIIQFPKLCVECEEPFYEFIFILCFDATNLFSDSALCVAGVQQEAAMLNFKSGISDYLSFLT